VTVINNTSDNAQSTISADDYHQRSKHSLKQYSAGPETLDWSMQPDPFRVFKGCQQIPLSLNADNLNVNFNDLYISNKVFNRELTLDNISTLFEISLGLSAWKQYGPDKWSLRCNPSSGNLHPTEAYLVNWDKNIITPAIYHYRSDQHALEQRCDIDITLGDSLKEQNQSSEGFIIGLSSIHWREAWKYGERAYRYCQLDIGHAIGAITYAAACLGWKVLLLDNLSDQQINSLLGLTREADFGSSEREYPDTLLYISTHKTKDVMTITSIVENLCGHVNQLKWYGQANILDSHPFYHWPIIENAVSATIKPKTTKLITRATKDNLDELYADKEYINASNLLRKRRSAQAFDSKESIPADTFFYMLERLLPHNTLPWSSISLTPRIHPVFYVHRVDGLKPGLYVLIRDTGAMKLLKNNMRKEFSWSKVNNCPDNIPLYELVLASSQKAARTVSCHQDIAADSAFTISMLSEYKTTLCEGDWNYRYLHWEAGLIGQVLYLEAEAANLRATGIGCFFDDTVHELMGIDSKELQVIYHFTVGTPVIDGRMISSPPYNHLMR